MNPLTLGCAATLAFAAIYMLAGWANPRVTPHYYQVAQRPELRGPVRIAASWLLRAALIYALLGWVAEIAAVTRIVVHPWPIVLALIGYVVAMFFACGVLLVIVWVCFRMQSEYTSMSPEFLVAIVMGGFEVFAIFPRTHYLWHWLPGLN
jgi:hypothetical protein